MPYPKKDPSTLRQFRIIKLLYRMKPLQSTVLAERLNVSTRTILRDMRRIEKVIPLLHSHGSWALDTEAVLRPDYAPLTHTLLAAFAHNLDMEPLCFDHATLTEERVSFAIEYRHLPRVLGEQIVDALGQGVQCTFLYRKGTGSTRRRVDPLKFYTESGRWYLVARDYKDDKVKTFLLSRIKEFKLTQAATTLTEKMRKEAEEIKSVWSTEGSTVSVRLYVKPEIADYFEDIKLHKTQKITERHYDGGLELSCRITHTLELLPAVKSWLPHIHILEPKWLQEDLMRDLEYYKDEEWKMDT